MNTFVSFILAMRLKTLSAAVIPVWAACMIVWRHTGTWNVDLGMYTLASALCLQIACNFFNDAIDSDKKADTKERKGPQRMTATGRLSASTVKLCALGFLGLAALFAYPLIELRGWVILMIGLPSMYFTYGYTGGPFPLAYKGLGEAFVVLFFGLVATLGSIFVQIGCPQDYLSIYSSGFVVGLQCGLLSAVMILVNNIRDRKEDEKTQKKTLVVRLGDARSRRLATACIVASYVTLPTALRSLGGFLTWYWVPLVLLAGLLIMKVNKTPANKKMNAVLALASFHLLAYLATLTFAS